MPIDQGLCNLRTKTLVICSVAWGVNTSYLSLTLRSILLLLATHAKKLVRWQTDIANGLKPLNDWVKKTKPSSVLQIPPNVTHETYSTMYLSPSRLSRMSVLKNGGR